MKIIIKQVKDLRDPLAEKFLDDAIEFAKNATKEEFAAHVEAQLINWLIADGSPAAMLELEAIKKKAKA